MPTINITETLRNIIKDERKKRNISSVRLSELISKGNAYISQIESGKISSIKIDIFYDIFDKLIDLPNDQRNEYIKTNILDRLSIKMSKKELEEQAWYIMFDMKIRKFPINETLRKWIINKRSQLNLTTLELVEYINQNNDLKDREKDKLKPNQLSIKFNDDGTSEASIFFHFEDDFITNIENQSIEIISYIDMQGIIYNLFRIEGVNIADAIERSEILLRQNDFLTISERKQIIRKNLNQKSLAKEDFNHYDLEPTEFLKEHGKILDNIISAFQYIRDKNISYSLKQITQLEKNMKSDIGLMYAIFGFPFDKLESLDFETKKKIIFEMKNLINSYIPESQMLFEDH